MVDTGIDKEFISAEEIAQTVARLGKEINDYYCSRPELDLLVIGLLRGSFVFMADLIRHIELPLTVDFMTVSSYGDATTSTGVRTHRSRWKAKRRRVLALPSETSERCIGNPPNGRHVEPA